MPFWALTTTSAASDGQQGGAGLVGKHMKAGSIDEIDFDALPLGKGDGVLHGCAAGYFFFVIGGDGRAIFDAALGWGHLGGMQQSGDQGWFCHCAHARLQLRCGSHFPGRFSFFCSSTCGHLRWGHRPSAVPRQKKARRVGLMGTSMKSRSFDPLRSLRMTDL